MGRGLLVATLFLGVLGWFLLAPTPTPSEIVITREVPVVIQVEATATREVIQEPTPDYSQVFGARVLPDVHVTTQAHSREVVMLTYWELMEILAETGWRPYITSVMLYDPESDAWIHDITYQRQLYALAFCESTLNPDAVGDQGDSIGLFQIHKPSWPELTQGVDLFNPVLNAEIAYQIWKASDQSFKHWSCKPGSTGGREVRNNDRR